MESDKQHPIDQCDLSSFPRSSYLPPYVNTDLVLAIMTDEMGQLDDFSEIVAAILLLSFLSYICLRVVLLLLFQKV